MPILRDGRLTEMCFGVYEGTANVMSLPDCPIRTLLLHPEEYTVPAEGAESLDELFARTGEFLREVAEPRLARGEDVLIVGHGAMNASIVCQVRGLPLEQFWSAGLENCRLVPLP